MPRGDTPLPDALELLLGKDRDAWPPEAKLLAAACDGHIRRLKEIAKNMDDDGKGIPGTVASATYIGMNALHAAANHGSLPALHYLVEKLNMDVNKPENTIRGLTPLKHAVCNGHLPAARFLIDDGANLHFEVLLLSVRLRIKGILK